jgi:hypothetical protein
MEKCSQTFWAAIVIIKKTAQRNESPKSRKFAQSGHPAHESREVLFSRKENFL